MSLVQYQMKSKIGTLYLVASSIGLQSLGWQRQALPLLKVLNRLRPEEKILDDTSRQLTEYFADKRKEFKIPLDLKGTDFQKKVWVQLAKIPFGQTVAYKDIAQKIKNPKAVRAVGSANGKNPVCVMIPCHRVIASDGSIGGYSGGVSIKKQLLQLEQVKAFV